jgi:hypothetical protein
MSKKDICRYFLKGNCNKGDLCLYDHIKDNLLINEESNNAVERFIEKIPNKRAPNKNTLKYSKEGREQMKIAKNTHCNDDVNSKFLSNIRDKPQPQKCHPLNNSNQYEHKHLNNFENANNKRDNKKTNNNIKKHNNNQVRIKNTESFEPNHTPADMRVLVEIPVGSQIISKLQTQDVLIVPNLFGNHDDLSIYNNLLKEMEQCGIDDLWKSWHGDNHLIADDHRNYKEKVPTFMSVINKIKDYFKMDIKATRFNWYRNDKEWKPFHHDASYIDPEKAKIQNFTVGVSFGATRDIAFEDAIENKGHRRVISFPLVNGTTYAFTRDINSNWRHGVPQLAENKQRQEGRISIIAWGFVNQEEAKSDCD